MHGFSALDGGFFTALGKAGNFFGAARFPFQFVGAFEELAIFFELASVGVEDGVGFEEGVELGKMSSTNFLIDKLGYFGR